MTVAERLRRPEIDWSSLSALIDDVPSLEASIAEQVETDLKYAGYLHREEAARPNAKNGVCSNSCGHGVLGTRDLFGSGRTTCAAQLTLGAAARLPGVTPAAIDMLAVLLARRNVG